MGVPLTAWRHNPLLSGSVQAEVQPQNIRAYFVQLPWGSILALFLIRSVVLWGSAKGWTVPPVLAKPHLLVISHTPHGRLERLMISDKMQMTQLCSVQASFMLASPAAFSVSMGHCALVCLWYIEMPWQSRQQHFTLWVREGKEKRVTSSCLSHRTSGLLQRRCQMPSAHPCWSTSFKLMNTQHFSEREASLHLDTHLKVYDSSHGVWLLFTYTSAIWSTSKPLLWSMLGYPRYGKYATNPLPMLIQT